MQIYDSLANYRPDCIVKYRSASIAAMQPLPAAVIAWRYLGSCTSPAANTPFMFVSELLGRVIMYPSGLTSTQGRKGSELG